MVSAEFYENCTLCPRKCGARRMDGQTGFCGAGDSIRVARAALHFGEEPPISGENGSGTVFFSHCSMRCVFCQNRPISHEGQGKDISQMRLCDVFLSLQEQGAHNLNLVTGAHFVPSIIAALDSAKEKGFSLPVVYNSSGYENVETLKLLEGYIDIYIPDLKYKSEYYSGEYSCAEDYFDVAQRAIDEMVRQQPDCVFGSDGMMQRGVIVRHLMLPDCVGDSLALLRQFSARWKAHAYLSLMRQYTPMGTKTPHENLKRPLLEAEYARAIDEVSVLGITHGFLQEATACGKDFIPIFDESGV